MRLKYWTLTKQMEKKVATNHPVQSYFLVESFSLISWWLEHFVAPIGFLCPIYVPKMFYRGVDLDTSEKPFWHIYRGKKAYWCYKIHQSQRNKRKRPTKKSYSTERFVGIFLSMQKKHPYVASAKSFPKEFRKMCSPVKKYSCLKKNFLAWFPRVFKNSGKLEIYNHRVLI